MEITSTQIMGLMNQEIPSDTNIAHSLNVGDILVLRIQAMDGDTLLFSNNKGSYLTANMLESASLGEGDTVEMIVSERSESQYTLKILDVVPKLEQGIETPAGDFAKNSENLDQKKAPSMAMLTSTMMTMKQNPGTSPKLASFIAENHMVPSAEQVGALNQMISAQTQTGALLYEIFTGLAELIKPRVLTMESEPSQPAEQAINLPTQGEPAPPQTSKTTEVKSEAFPIQTEPVSQEIEGEIPQAKPANKIVHIQSLLKNMWDNDTSSAIKGDRDLPLKQMLTKTLAAFYAPDEPKNANALKKTIEKLPLQLKELKVLLESNDTKSKESFLVKVNQAEKQIETLTEIKHINCFHVPIWLGNRPASTAELYVYQRKKNKTNSEQKGLTALLGIDTQNMGRVEVMVGLDRLSVDMDIGVERKDVLTAFEQNKDVLAATFEKQGYRMVGFKADMLEKRTTVLNVETRLAERSKMSNDRLDVRI